MKSPMCSLRIVTDERVAKFVGEKIDRVIYPPYTVMGIERHGEVISGAVFNCFTRRDIHATIAGSVWTRSFLREVGNYVFSQLKCERITVITHQTRVESLAARLGGRREGILRNYFGPDLDGILIGILKAEYRF